MFKKLLVIPLIILSMGFGPIPFPGGFGFWKANTAQFVTATCGASGTPFTWGIYSGCDYTTTGADTITFTSVPANGKIRRLIVGASGTGAADQNVGGTAGGGFTDDGSPTFSIAAGTYNLTVGAPSAAPCARGGDSNFDSTVVHGGGCTSAGSGAPGGSGGGSGSAGTPGAADGFGTGNNGGQGFTSGPLFGAGGGGGCGSVGGAGSSTDGGAGASGCSSDITGSTINYSCGGGGAVSLTGTGGAAGCNTATAGSVGTGACNTGTSPNTGSGVGGCSGGNTGQTGRVVILWQSS